MNNTVDRRIVLLLMPPLAAIGSWFGHYFGSAHQTNYGPWFSSTDIAVAIGIALAAAIAWAIAQAKHLSTRRLLLWIALPIYALVGSRLGYLVAGSLIDSPTVGLSLGALIGCAAGNVARLAVVAQERSAEGHAT